MATYEIRFSKTVREFRIVTVTTGPHGLCADTPSERALAVKMARKLVKDEDEDAGGHSDEWCDGDNGRIRIMSTKEIS
jgi:hypothetical protein